MPYPRKGEKKSGYIKRAIKYFMEVEGLPRRVAIGRAEGFWDYYGRKRK